MGSCASCERPEQREKDLESRPPLTVASSRLRRPQRGSFGRCWAQSALSRLPTATSFLCHQRVGLCFQRPVGSTGDTRRKRSPPPAPQSPLLPRFLVGFPFSVWLEEILAWPWEGARALESPSPRLPRCPEWGALSRPPRSFPLRGYEVSQVRMAMPARCVGKHP